MQSIHETSVPLKVVYVVVGVLFLVLGVIGLIIPIIPGLLFLVGAIYIFGKVSRRVRGWSDANPTFREVNARMERMSTVGAMDRVRVGCLWCLDAFVRGADRLMGGIARLIRKF